VGVGADGDNDLEAVATRDPAGRVDKDVLAEAGLGLEVFLDPQRPDVAAMDGDRSSTLAPIAQLEARQPARIGAVVFVDHGRHRSSVRATRPVGFSGQALGLSPR
jgi:hypothetical protein